MENTTVEFDKLDINQLCISNFVKTLDVKDKSALIMITTKLEAGMLLMSSTYGRYFQSILPFMVVARSKFEENEKMYKICRKKFASMTRTYIRTDMEAAREQPAVYALKTENYDIILSKEDHKQLESHLVISLADIDAGLKNTLNRLNTLFMYPINTCENSFEFNDAATDDIADMVYVINATFEDIGKAFFDADSNRYIDDYIEKHGKMITEYGYTVIDLIGISNTIKYIMNYLTILYKLICRVHTEISKSIDLATPINMEETGKTFEELYSDFCKANDTSIKNDPQITGFSIPKSKRKKPFFNRDWFIGDSEDMNEK